MDFEGEKKGWKFASADTLTHISTKINGGKRQCVIFSAKGKKLSVEEYISDVKPEVGKKSNESCNFQAKWLKEHMWLRYKNQAILNVILA